MKLITPSLGTLIKAVSGTVSLLLVTSLLSSCAVQPATWTEWEYIVPDGYQGFLVIRYDCPGGIPFVRSGQRITVRFDQTGVFCANEMQTHTFGPVPKTVTTTGRSLPYVIDPWTYSGWGVCCGHSIDIGGSTQENPGPDLTLDVQWVGLLQPRRRTESEFPDSFELFWKCRFLWNDVQPVPIMCREVIGA